MPTTPHTEEHFSATDTVRDIVIGMSDGLTVPFALAAGLTGVASSTTLVVTGGLAEIAAGSIAMGLGGYLAARTDAQHYDAERRREVQETLDVPEVEAEEVADVFRGYGLREDDVATVVTAMRQDQDRWVDFMMRFELGLEAPDPTRARKSAATIGGSYIVGGLIPLSPYIVLHGVNTALVASVALTLFALLVFGAVKGHFTGLRPWRSGLQTMLVGGLAAAAAFAIARFIGGGA
ncbi:MAG: VIT1/CCC1 transporter family protein [Gemmatimonadota bacterium]